MYYYILNFLCAGIIDKGTIDNLLEILRVCDTLIKSIKKLRITAVTLRFSETSAAIMYF